MKAGRLEGMILAHREDLLAKASSYKNLFRLQDMADGGKQKDGALRPIHQGRSNRVAPAIVSAMSYMLEIRPAAT